jgi:tRNA (guanine37-N1)-methyltransferase
MAEDMFRPPVNRAMRVLDRSFFQKKIPASAARVVDNKTISKCRSDLFRSKDVLRLERYQIVRPDPNEADAKAGKKCILLRPQVDEKGEPSYPRYASHCHLTSPQVSHILGAKPCQSWKSQT